MADLAYEVREAARVDVARRGLAASYGGVPILALARELAGISRDGLRRIGHTVEVEDTPAVRGMVNKVHYLVKVEG